MAPQAACSRVAVAGMTQWLLTGNRWRRKAPTAGSLFRKTELFFETCCPTPHCLITPRSWITSSHCKGSVGYVSRPAIAWQERGHVLRKAVKLWQSVYSHLELSEKSNLWMWLSICIHTHIIKQPAALCFRRHQLDCFSHLVQLNILQQLLGS